MWGEVVQAAGDILDLRSTKRHPDKTPNEFFCGKKPSIDHLRIFGSPFFVHIPKPSCSKLKPRSRQCVLLSFDEAARCYRLSTRKVFISRDLFIDEVASSPLHQAPTLKSDIPDNIPAPKAAKELRSCLTYRPQRTFDGPNISTQDQRLYLPPPTEEPPHQPPADDLKNTHRSSLRSSPVTSLFPLYSDPFGRYYRKSDLSNSKHPSPLQSSSPFPETSA